MVILPLRCKECGWTVEIRSDEPMPRCATCNGRMGPAGKVRAYDAAESRSPSEAERQASGMRTEYPVAFDVFTEPAATLQWMRFEPYLLPFYWVSE